MSIKAGRFYDGKNFKIYSVFEMAESKFYRLDICTEDTTVPFLATNTVLFSIYRRKKEFFWGDRKLYSEYMDCRSAAVALREELRSKTSLEAGHITLEQYKQKDDNNYYKTLTEDGVIKEELYAIEGSWIQLRLMHVQLLKEIMPLNAKEYVPLEFVEKSGDASEYISLDTLRKMYDIEHIMDYDYGVLDVDRKILKDFCDLIIAEDKKSEHGKGYDTETSGLDFNLYSTETVTGFIMSAFEHHARYVPFGHIKFENYDIEDFKWAIEYMYKNGVRFIAHGKIFETKIFLKYGIQAKIKHCSRILATLIDSVLIKGAHALKNLEYERTGRVFLELKQIFPGSINFPILDKEITRVYACPDADNGEQVFLDRWRFMKSNFPMLEAVYNLELELADLKAEQEYYGMRVDPDFVMKGAKESLNNALKMKGYVTKLAGEEFDIDSNKVLSHYLYERLKCKTYIRTKKGFPSTGASALAKIASITREEPLNIFKEDITDASGKKAIVKAKDLNKAKYPTVLLIQKYRDYKKQQTGFYDKINSNKKGDRFFFWINPNGTETGRQSSPMHMMSKECRPAFQADSDHHHIVAADYQQMELRVNFILAGETELVLLAKDADVDLHRAISSIIQNKEIWDISSEERSADKARNFGVVYLMSGQGLAVSKYGVGASKSEIKKCSDSIDTFYRTFKRCKRFTMENTKKVLSKHYIDTLYGRIRRFDDLANPNLDESAISSIIRKANNMPVQGLSADIMKLTEVKMNRYIKEKGWDKLVDTPQGRFPLVRVMVSIHDEVLLSKHVTIAMEEIQAMIISCMETNIEIEGKESAPLFVGVKLCRNWGDSKVDELDIPRNLSLKMIDDYARTGKSVLTSDNPVEELLGIINKFRDEEIHEYMEGLIRQAGSTEVEAIWNLLRHPKFTHELIARFPQSKESIEKDGAFNHHDQMRLAISEYLKLRSLSAEEKEVLESSKVDLKVLSTKATDDSERQEDLELTEEFENLVGITAEMYNDENPDTDEVEEGDYVDEKYLVFLDEIKAINKVAINKSHTLITMFDEIILDADVLTNEQANAILALLWENEDSQGFYSVSIIKEEKVIDAKFRIETLKNEELIQETLKRFEEENEKLMGAAM